MDEASSDLDFERAAIYRDRIRALTQIQQHQGINPRTVVEADLFAAWTEGGQTCVQVFFFRAGQNWGNRAYFPRHDKELSTEEVLDAFLAQFYEDRPPPRMVLLSHDVPGRASSPRRSRSARNARSRSVCRDAARSANSSTTR